eukprot:GHVN01053009.1.p1 GENE.GHVN01053009.1~~GHVN01053009.1.p1  ORF type:complete len:1158 (+),score=90.86 GHVN01053009.1:33-3506(+)
MFSAELLRRVVTPPIMGAVRLSDAAPYISSELMQDLMEQIADLMNRQDFKTAVAVLEYYIGENPDSIPLYLALSHVLRQANELIEGMDVCRAALYLDPTNQKATLQLNHLEELYLQNKCQMPTPLLVSLLKEATAKPQKSGQAFTFEAAPPFRVLAKRALKPGEEIHSEAPFVVVPNINAESPLLFPTCFHCLRERIDMDRAYSCPMFPHTCPYVFCSWECLLKNVRVHNSECGCMPFVFSLARKSSLAPSLVHLLLRALIRASLQREVRSKKQEEILALFDLPGYVPNFKRSRPWLWNNIVTLAEGIRQNFPPHILLGLNDDELHELIAIFHTNAIPLFYEAPSAVFQRAAPVVAIGLGIFQTISSFQHSCVPTCSFVYTPEGEGLLTSITEIPEGGHLAFSLICDLFQPQNKRKDINSTWKIIYCGCARCTDPTDGGRHLRSQRCKICIRGFRSPGKSQNLRSILDGGNLGNQKQGDVSAEAKNKWTQEPWACNLCGPCSPQINLQSAALEQAVLAAYADAEKEYRKGKLITARRKMEDMRKQYVHLLHPNHHTMYNVHCLLAGLCCQRSGRDVLTALDCHRKATVAAEAVLPVFHAEKIHLYTTLNDTVFAASMMHKVSKRGPGCPHEFLLKALWMAAANAFIVWGAQSATSLAAIQRLRTFALMCGMSTPPTLHRARVGASDKLVTICRRLFGNNALSLEEVVRLVNEDYSKIIFAAANMGSPSPFEHLCEDDATFLREMGVVNLGTGLTALGTAAARGHVKLVSWLVSRGCEMLATNEWGVTPLLAMAATPLPADHEAAARVDKNQAAILGIFIREAVRIEDEIRTIVGAVEKEIGEFKRKGKVAETLSVRQKLLDASTHPLIGQCTALHLAAARKKETLVKVLLRSGSSINASNVEWATPIHLAAALGASNIVGVLLRHQDVDVNVLNRRGESPLMAAAYALDPACVDLLIQAGADVAYQNEKTRLTALHALVCGVGACHKASFLSLGRRDGDLINSVIHPSELPFQIKGTAATQPEFVTYLSNPIVEPCPNDLVIWSSEMVERINRGLTVAVLLIRHSPLWMYEQPSSSGYTPAEMLKQLWERVISNKSLAMNKSDVRISALTTEDTSKIEEGWAQATQKVNRLITWLTPDKLKMIELSEGLDPRHQVIF